MGKERETKTNNVTSGTDRWLDFFFESICSIADKTSEIIIGIELYAS